MAGCTVAQASGFGNAPTTWSIAGTGDFNGDGVTDILWRDSNTGTVAWFLGNGPAMLSEDAKACCFQGLYGHRDAWSLIGSVLIDPFRKSLRQK